MFVIFFDPCPHLKQECSTLKHMSTNNVGEQEPHKETDRTKTSSTMAVPSSFRAHTARAMSALLPALLLLSATTTVGANSLVGPGGMVPFGGGGGGGRRTSYGVVRDAAKGFFVTGSSLKGVNGIFERVGWGGTFGLVSVLSKTPPLAE